MLCQSHFKIGARTHVRALFQRFAAPTALLTIALLSGSALAPSRLHADEGMWLPNQLPVSKLKAKYDFNPSPAWTSNAIRSCLNFDGASSSFVSADGLIMTNNHVSEGPAQQISTPQHNYFRDGFIAHSLTDEIPIPGLTLYQLQNIQDVTARVVAAGSAPSLTSAEAQQQREAEMSRIEQETDKTGMYGEVVTLFGGARYNLYRSKAYTDVRLVFKPEDQTGNFGGNADNFEYPRFDLDVAFFRAYENGKPAQTPSFLKFSPNGAADGQLIFAWGHPGTTERYATMPELIERRDVGIPAIMNDERRIDYFLHQYALYGPEPRRLTANAIYGIENGLKDQEGQLLLGLQDPEVIAAKATQEAGWAAELKPYPAEYQSYLTARATLATVAQRQAKMVKISSVGRRVSGTPMLASALRLVYIVLQSKLPDAQRLPGYHDADLADGRRILLTPIPVSKDLTRRELADALGESLELLGRSNPLTQTLLAGMSPDSRAAMLVDSSHMDDVNARKQLLDGGEPALRASADPMVKLALALYPAGIARSQANQTQITAPQEEASATIVRLLLKHAPAGSLYPDATDTLRMTYGVIKGYTSGGVTNPPFTTFGGFYNRADQRGDVDAYALPASWQAARSTLDPATPFNFVCTLDSTGGNSGSPVINTDGQIIGILFDGNMEGNVQPIVYTEVKGRTICVDSRAIVSAVRTVYHDDLLANEITTGKLP